MKSSPVARAIGTLAILASAFMAAPAVSDELVLKDGKKITGTVVGFENGMFKVETEFGFALVRKDKVATINITSGPEKPPLAKTEKAEKKEAPPTVEAAAPEKPVESPNPAAAVTSPVPPPPEPSHPLDEPLPASLAEHIQGTNYFSDTFHFVMFKPPDWKLYEEISREKVSAIVAMSGDNDRTLLIVDRTVWSGAPDLKADAVDAKIRGMVENYTKVSEASVQVGGLPAIRRSFTGVLDGAEWHGVTAHVAAGNTVFGIIGMTSAENYQFEEAIFGKIINSFRFLSPAAESGRFSAQDETARK